MLDRLEMRNKVDGLESVGLIRAGDIDLWIRWSMRRNKYERVMHDFFYKCGDSLKGVSDNEVSE